MEPARDRHRAAPARLRAQGAGTRTAIVEATRDGTTVAAGVADLVIMKSADSAFDGFPRDEYTTLPETRDRLLATALTAVWQYSRTDVDFTACGRRCRTRCSRCSPGIRASRCSIRSMRWGRPCSTPSSEVAAIRLTMPNKHHLPVDLSRFGLENRNEIFVATEEPHGLIEATLAAGTVSGLQS